MNCSLLSIPYITLLGVSLLLIAGLAIFMIRRMNNQNHKFYSIVGVVTSMAEEISRLKHIITNTLVPSQLNANHTNINTEHNTKEIILNQHSLIPVSDDSDDDDSDDDDSDDDDSDDDDSNDDDSDDDDSDDKSSEDDKANNDSDKNEDNDKVEEDTLNANIYPIIIENNDEDKNITLKSEDINNTIKYIHLDEKPLHKNEGDDEVLLQKIEDVEVKVVLDVEVETKFDAGTGDETTEKDVQEVTLSSINETTQKLSTSKNYKRLSLEKLRTLIAEKNISVDTDIMKMKKNDLVSLLESSQ